MGLGTDDPDDVLEALASLPSFHHPTASPDGDRVAVYYDDTGRNELHVVDAESGDRRRVTDGEVPRNARWWTRWGPDGDRVYFHRGEGGDEQNDIYAVDLDGTVERVVDLDGQVILWGVGDDGTLYLGATTEGQMNAYRQRPGGEPERLTDYDRAVMGLEVAPGGDRIAYATNERDAFENVDTYVADADGENARPLDVGEVGAETAPADWGPEGRRLLLSDNSEDLGRAGVYDVEEASVTWLGDGDAHETAHSILPDGRTAVVTRTRRAGKVPVVYDLETGDGRELDVPEGVTAPPEMGEAALANDRLLLSHTASDRRPELLAYDLADHEHEPLLSAEYAPFDPSDFVEAEYVRFPSDGVPDTPARAVDHDPSDELEIGALLYDSGEHPSPLIVNPHGGPRQQDAREFDVYTQFLCSRGYSVLQVNYRGSSGRGREFAQRLYDDWGGAEQGDVATGVEHVLQTRDWIDEDRVAVFGGSYGGYSAYWQLVQYPDLYDAGIAWIGVTDLDDFYENTMPHFRTELLEKHLGPPEENPALYRERSPIEYVENLAAPLLIVHGVNDERVPVSQARLFRDALEAAGYEEGDPGDFEYVELGEEGHASTDVDQKIRLFRTLADFLERRAPPADEAITDRPED